MFLFHIIFSVILCIYLCTSGIFRYSRYFARAFSFFIFPGVLFYYIYGMARSAGVDYETYVDYFSDPDLVFDKGFKILVKISNYLEINFTEFLVLQSLLTVYAIFKISRKLGANLTIAFTIFILHSAVVRDFSQSRIGLAVAIVFLAFSEVDRFRKLILFVLAVSMHLSSIVSIVIPLLSSYLAPSKSTKLTLTMVFVFMVMVITRDSLAGFFSIIDPRISIYLNWQEEGYGDPVSGYSSLGFYFLLFFTAYLSFVCTRELFYKEFAIQALFAITIFITLSGHSIFAHRLAHLAVVLYPFVLARIFESFTDKKRLFRTKKFFTLIATGCIILLVTFRQGSKGILDSIIVF